MFTTDFGRHASPGDTITCEADGFTVTARLEYDDAGDKPDERDAGFWPSRDPKAAGYVLPEYFAAEQAKAEDAMRAWLDDEWCYVGVCLTVEKAGVQLTDQYSNALWGVECSYPGADNSHLRQVANDLVPEALKEARAMLRELRGGEGQPLFTLVINTENAAFEDEPATEIARILRAIADRVDQGTFDGFEWDANGNRVCQFNTRKG